MTELGEFHSLTSANHTGVTIGLNNYGFMATLQQGLKTELGRCNEVPKRPEQFPKHANSFLLYGN